MDLSGIRFGQTISCRDEDKLMSCAYSKHSTISVSSCDGGDCDGRSLTPTEYYVQQHGVERDIDEKHAMVWNSIQGKLFEREPHQQVLQEAYQRNILLAHGKKEHLSREIVLITGPSGTGKSFLAQTICNQATNDNVYVLYGKCEFQQTSEPIAPFVRAFTDLVEQILKRSEQDDTILQKVQAVILEATRESRIDYLTDLIPSFKKLLKSKSDEEISSDLSTTIGKTTNRAAITRPNAETPGITILSTFLKRLCFRDEFPIFLLIDDLQWLDSKSIQLFNSLALAPLQRFLLVGTCRGNEVRLHSELSVMLRGVEDQGVVITDIQVECLRLESVCQMLQEMLQCENSNDVASLAFLAYRLTGGNPFFVVELMRSLFAEHLLTMDKNGKWSWNEADILGRNQCLDNAEITDSIVQGLIHSDFDPMKETLQIASCLGTEFSAYYIKVSCTEPRVVLRTIQVLVYRRILLKTSEEGKYRWAHDRFQTSALHLIPEGERARFKCQIAMKLLDHFTQKDVMENAFLVAGLLCEGNNFLKTDADKQRSAELFSIAGVKAALASAFVDAATYFRKGIEILPHDHWNRSLLYLLCQQLYNGLAEMECCLGNTIAVDRLCGIILQHSKSLQDQMRAYDTLIYSLSYGNKMNESVRVALEVLRKLGEPVPHKVGVFMNLKELVTTRRLLSRSSWKDILQLPQLQKWEKVAALRIINIVFPSVLRSRPDYALFLTAKAIKITFRHGLSPLSAVLFSMFSMILCNPVGAIEEGIRCEDIGYRIFEKFEANDLRSRMLVIRYGYIKPWTDPMPLCLPHQQAGASAGMLTGDFEMAFISSFIFCVDSLLCGTPLIPHYEKMEQVKEQFTALGQETVMFYLDAMIQLTQNLLGNANDITVLTGKVFDEKQSLSRCIATNNAAGISFILLPKLFLAVFTNDYEKAVVVARQIQQSNCDNLTAYAIQYIAFLTGLSEMIMARQSKRNVHIRAGDRALKRLEKLTKHCTEMSWMNRIHFVKAERDAFRGCHEEAIREFVLSIDVAQRCGRVHEEALAYERVGLLYSELGQKDKAIDCLSKAKELYERWGCVVKSALIIDLMHERIGKAQNHDTQFSQVREAAASIKKSQ